MIDATFGPQTNLKDPTAPEPFLHQTEITEP